MSFIETMGEGIFMQNNPVRAVTISDATTNHIF